MLLVDDHAVVREGLRTYLELQDGIEVAGEAADGAEGVAAAERLRPDVILMDLVMPRLDGVGAMRELRRRLPGVRVIVLTSFTDDAKLLPAVQAGAAGYLLKNAQPQEIARAVRAAAAGEALLDPGVAARLLDSIAEPARAAPGESLTRREREVLGLIGRGFSNKRIALELGIAEKTVKTHVGHVLASSACPTEPPPRSTRAGWFPTGRGRARGGRQRRWVGEWGGRRASGPRPATRSHSARTQPSRTAARAALGFRHAAYVAASRRPAAAPAPSPPLPSAVAVSPARGPRTNCRWEPGPPGAPSFGPCPPPSSPERPVDSDSS